MKKFLLKLSFYSILPILYLGYGEWKLYQYGESIPVSYVVTKQLSANHEFYFLRKYFGFPFTLYKMDAIKKVQPDVLILGQSIVLQYRNIMFKPYEKSFYNAGLAIRNVYDVASFVKQIKSHTIHQPKLIVFGFDHSMIKQDFIYDYKNHIENPDSDDVYDPLKHLMTIQAIISAKIHKTDTEPYIKNLGYGKSGGWGFGFRRDGSTHEKITIEKFLLTHRYEDSYNTKSALHRRTKQFYGKLKVDDKKIAILLNAFHELKSMGIDLLIYFPPISADYFNYAIQDAEFATVFHKYLMVQNQLINMGYNVIPFSTPKQIGLNDNYMLDALHPSEVMVIKQLLSHISDNFPYCSKESLNELLNRKRTNSLSLMLDSTTYSSNDYFK